MASRPHVVVIGAGFGGLRVVKGLRRAAVDVTVIDPNNFHTFQPLLYQVATAGLDAGDVSFPVRGILRRSGSARFVLGAVTAIDLERRIVTVDDGDHASLTTTSSSPPGRSRPASASSGVDEHTYPLKTLHDAIAAAHPTAVDVRARRHARSPPAGRDPTCRSSSSAAARPASRPPEDSASWSTSCCARTFPNSISTTCRSRSSRRHPRARTISSQVVAAGA